jgi:hypothetical protein
MYSVNVPSILLESGSDRDASLPNLFVAKRRSDLDSAAYDRTARIRSVSVA